MTLRRFPNCKVCRAISRGTPEAEALLKRIYNSKAFIRGGEGLMAVQRDYKDLFSYDSLMRHVQRHQALTPEQLTDRRLKQIQKQAVTEQVKRVVKYGDLQDLILTKGYEQLDNDQIKLTASSLVGMTKQKSDKEDKQVDQNMQFMKMLQLFASGEQQIEFDHPERLPDRGSGTNP